MTARRILLVAVGLTLAAGVAVGPGAAGDGSTVVYPAQEQYTAQPGERIEVDIVLGDHRNPNLGRLEQFRLVAAYNDSALTVTAVEPAGWFARDDPDAEIHTETEVEGGIVTLSQRADDGATGTGRFATLTVAVDADASAGATVVGLENSTASLADGYAVPVFVDAGDRAGPEIRIRPADERSLPAGELAWVALGGLAVAALAAAVALHRSR